MDRPCYARVSRRRASWRSVVPAVTVTLMLLGSGCVGPLAPRREAGTPVASSEPAGVQKAKVTVPPHAFLDVYYPAPYISAPGLDLRSPWSRCVVVTSSANRFRVLNQSDSETTAEWVARGVPAAPGAPPAGQRLTPTPARAPASTSGNLPAEPLPVEAPAPRRLEPAPQ